MGVCVWGGGEREREREKERERKRERQKEKYCCRDRSNPKHENTKHARVNNRFAMRIGLGLGSASGEMKREIDSLANKLTKTVARATRLEKEVATLQASLHRREMEIRRCGGHAVERSMRAVRHTLVRLLKSTLRPHEIEELLKLVLIMPGMQISRRAGKLTRDPPPPTPPLPPPSSLQRGGR